MRKIMSDLSKKYAIKSDAVRARDIIEGKIEGRVKKEALLWTARQIGTGTRMGAALEVAAEGVVKTAIYKGLETVGGKSLLATGKAVGRVIGGPVGTAAQAAFYHTDLNPGEDELISMERARSQALAKLTPGQRSAIEEMNAMPARLPQFATSEIETEIAALRQLYTTTKAELDDLRRQQDQNQMEKMRLEEDLFKNQKEIEECEQNLTDKTIEKEQTDEEIMNQQGRLQTLKSKERELENESYYLSRNIKEREAKISLLDKQKQSCELRITQLRDELKRKKLEFEQLKQKLPFYCENHGIEAMAAGACGKLNEECAKYGPQKMLEVKKYLSSLAIIDGKIKEIESDISYNESNIKYLNESIGQEEGKLARIKDELMQKQEKKNSLEAESSFVEEHLQQAQDECERIRKDIYEFTETKQKLSLERESFTSDLDRLQVSIDKSAIDISNKERDLQAAHSELEDAQLRRIAQQELMAEQAAVSRSSLKF